MYNKNKIEGRRKKNPPFLSYGRHRYLILSLFSLKALEKNYEFLVEKLRTGLLEGSFHSNTKTIRDAF